MAYFIVCLHLYVPPFIYKAYTQNETGRFPIKYYLALDDDKNGCA